MSVNTKKIHSFLEQFTTYVAAVSGGCYIGAVLSTLFALFITGKKLDKVLPEYLCTLIAVCIFIIPVIVFLFIAFRFEKKLKNSAHKYGKADLVHSSCWVLRRFFLSQQDSLPLSLWKMIYCFFRDFFSSFLFFSIPFSALWNRIYAEEISKHFLFFFLWDYFLSAGSFWAEREMFFPIREIMLPK